MANSNRSIIWQVGLLIILATSLMGCFSVYIFPGKAPKLSVATTPPAAVVYLQKLNASNSAHFLWWGRQPSNMVYEQTAIGTTPYEGVIPTGMWQLHIESNGYKPVDLVLDSKQQHNLYYNLALEKMAPTALSPIPATKKKS